MGYISLAFVLLLGAPSLVTGASKPLPSVYIQMDFKFTWPEFCLLETYFKTKMAELVIQDNGTPIMFSQVYLNNFDENCPAPKNSTKEVSLLFYVVQPNGGYQDVDVNLTIGAYKVLHYLVENKLGRMLGPLFELKIKKVEAKGEDAPPKPTGFTELERTYIAIGIAVGILAIIILFIVAVYFIKKRTKPNRRHQATHTTGEENKGIEIIESPPLNANKEQHVYEEPESPSSPAETKF